MVSSSELPADPAKALEYKDKGNKCFQSGDYEGAEVLYSKAIQHDPNNPLLYTNRSMALLKLSLYTRVVTDTQHAISLLPHNMKAYFQLAQAQMALQDPHSALISAKKAHAYCVEEVHSGGKGASSIGPITDLVLRCKREVWEEKERERERQRVGLLGDVINALEKQRRDEVQRLEGEDALEGEGMVERNKRLKEFEEKWDKKIENTRVVFERAELEERVKRRRKVPDWVVDNITFSVMLDPVVTNTGQSYDRSSIMQHLSRSPTDPLTREPLRPEDLRPNLALKAACEDFLEENGWAVDW
ncbi:U-box domain-containing protein [Diplocarpon mali]|nr:U-box domain-containing protein [Diplocarpon mali]